MKGKTIFGALLVSVALCSQGFGFELLNNLLGANGGGCGTCAKVAPCEAVKACPQPAACDPACEKACGQNSCGKCKKCRATPVRDLFAGLKDLCEAKGCYCEQPKGCCEAAKGCCPEPACEKVAACNPACEKACKKPCKTKKCRKACGKKTCGACCPVAACDPACEKVAACEPACEKTCAPKCHKLYRRPVLELLEDLFGDCKKCGKSCGTGCETGCEVGCAAGCGGAAPAKAAPTTAPAKAPETAPLPAAPKADPSASIQSRGVYQVSRSLVRN